MMNHDTHLCIMLIGWASLCVCVCGVNVCMYVTVSKMSWRDTNIMDNFMEINNVS